MLHWSNKVAFRLLRKDFDSGLLMSRTDTVSRKKRKCWPNSYLSYLLKNMQSRRMTCLLQYLAFRNQIITQ